VLLSRCSNQVQSFLRFHLKFIQDFRTEVTVHELLGHHPNVVTYFGANIQDDAKESPYIVMDYYTNGSLQDAIPPESKRKDVAIDALRGLLHVHESGYLHRDVAPRNFLLDHTFRAHICDFGLSALRPENAFDGTMIQTRREVKYLSLSLSLSLSLCVTHPVSLKNIPTLDTSCKECCTRSQTLV